MSTLKIVFVTPDRDIVVYGQGLKQLWQVESYVLEHLGEVLSQMQPQIERSSIRKYWIDDEQDQVEILNDVDYDFFLKRMGAHKTPKIYFEVVAKPATPPQGESSSRQPNAEDMSVHATVACDVCNVCPVIGFRYKCLECNNYDICMKCEGEMKHKDHVMLRIPTSDSFVAAAGCPAAFFGSRRRQKKYAAAAAAAVAAASAATTDDGGHGEGGKSRHYRHHRRHCGSSGSGVQHIISNFYDMMQGLAEGGAGPQAASAPASPEKTPAPEAEATGHSSAAEAAAVAAVAAQQAAAAANVAAATVAAATAATAGPSNTQSKETNTSPERSANAAAPSGQEFGTGSASAPPSFENLQNFIDPQFMKAGIQILNNFSEMFGKMLDPAVTTDATRPGSMASSVAAGIDLTGNDSMDSASQQQAASGSKRASTVASGEVTPMEAEVSSPHTPSSSPRVEENDWTMIDNSLPGVALPDAVTTSSSTDPASIAASVVSASQPLDFAKLSQQLQSHIENEKNTPVPVVPSPVTPAPVPAVSPSVTPAVITLPAAAPIPLPAPVTVQTQTQTQVPIRVPVTVTVTASAPAPTPAPTPAPQPTERRAVAVYHPDQRINTAIHAMMAMGFSNEGAVLTQLLESVNGDIPLALDLMTNVQRT